MDSNKSLGQGVLNALMFPFHLGTLAYNIVFTLLSALILSALFSLVVANVQFAIQNDAQLSQAVSELSQVDFNAEIDNDPNLTDEQKAQLKQLSGAMQKLGEGFNQSVNNDMPIPAPPANRLPLMILMAALGLLILTRNMDISAQIMVGDFDKPSFNPVKYVSPFIALKYIGAMILLMIGFFILSLIPIVGLLAIVAMFAFYFLFFAFIYTLIRSNSIMESINPSNWISNISSHLTWFNYCMLFLFLFFTAIFSTLISNAVMMGSSNVVLMLIVLAITQYFSLHLLTSSFYLLGYISQMNEAEGFEGYDSQVSNKSVKTKKSSSAEKNIALNEAKSVYQSGYIDDAIELIKRSLDNNLQTQPQHQFELKLFLAKLYQEKGNLTETNRIEDEIIDDALSNYPDRIPSIFERLSQRIKEQSLVISGDKYITLAEIAYQKSDIELIKILTKTFSTQHPNDPQLANLYFFVAKGVLEKENNAEQAYKIFFSLVKKYPNHPQILDFKSMLSLTKKRIIRERQQNAPSE